MAFFFFFSPQEGTHPHSINRDDFMLLRFIVKAWHFLACVTPPSPLIFPFVFLEHLSMTIDLDDKSWGGEKGHFVLSYLGSLYTWV